MNKIKKKQKKDGKALLKDKILSKFITSKTKSYKKRNKTLLVEYKFQNKSNRFIDRRIGERNRDMTVEDRAIARFAAEKAKSFKKKAQYNLGDDDDILTHAGRALQDIEKFEDPRSDDDDPEDTGKLKADYVTEAHFGGGLFSKVANDKVTPYSVIDQLILDSKKRKAERQLTKEHTSELTTKLDKDLNKLLPLMSKKQNQSNDTRVTPKNTESYDLIFNELKFEAVGKPGQKIKTDIEIEIEEKRKMEKLEEERVRRMKRSIDDVDYDDVHKEEPLTKIHHSADDLNDDFQIDNSEEEDDDDDDDDSGNGDDDSDEECSDDNNSEHNNCPGNGESNENASDKVACIDQAAEKNCSLAQSTHGLKFCNIPATYDDLKQLIGECSLNEQVELIRDIVLKNHPSAGGGSKESLMTIFPVILQHISHVTNSTNSKKDCWILFEKLAPTLFDLTQMCPDIAGQHVFNCVQEMQKLLANGDNSFSFDKLILLKMIPLLFPTSDYYHAVVTPCVILISQLLSQMITCHTFLNLTKGLFCATLLLEFIDLSHRFCPEVVNYLRMVLSMAMLNESPPVVAYVSEPNKILVLSSDCIKQFKEEELILTWKDLSVSEEMMDDNFRIRILHVTLKLVLSFVQRSKEFSASCQIWSPVLKVLNKIPIENYPEIVKSQYKTTIESIVELSSEKLIKLMPEKKRPKILRLYEPNIRQVIEGKSFSTVSQTKQDRDKLMYKYKKELKGAIKEIRKDRNFLANVKFTEQVKRDMERRARVRQIYNWGQTQQSELKRMERKNRFGR